MFAYGIDNEDNLWEWGSHNISNVGDKPFFEKVRPDAEERRSTPYKLVWFKNNGKTPIKAVCGHTSFGMILVKDNNTGE
jgi:hypothetical protein